MPRPGLGSPDHCMPFTRQRQGRHGQKGGCRRPLHTLSVLFLIPNHVGRAYPYGHRRWCRSPGGHGHRDPPWHHGHGHCALPVSKTSLCGCLIHVPSVRAARAVAVAAAVPVVVAIAVTAVLLARGVVAGAAAGRWGTTTTGRAGAATVAVPARLEAPRGRRGSTSPLATSVSTRHTKYRAWHTNLNLQDVITAEALVMHLVVGIIGITSILVLHKGEAVPCRQRLSSHVATTKRVLTVGSRWNEEQECRSGQGGHSCNRKRR